MKSIHLTLLAGMLVFQSAVSFADHETPEGSVRALAYETRQLDYDVRYSALRYQVKQSVSRFAYDVSRFVACVGFKRASRDHDLIPGSCYNALRAAESSFYPVDRYLYDTYYDYPYVYRSYVRVRDALRMVGGHTRLETEE